MSANALRSAPLQVPRQASAPRRPAATPTTGMSERPALSVVRRAEPLEVGRTWPVILMAVLALVAAIAIPLAVNTQMAQTSYEIRDQQVELAELEAQQAVLETRVLEVASPESLDAKARSLGLVPIKKIGTLSLIDGTLSGGEPASE